MKLQKRGFTLIELLVVIAIIAVLAAMGFGAGAMAINRAKKVHALSGCSNLVQAVQAYYDDYNTIPVPDNDIESAGRAPGIKSESALMNILVGIDREYNPKRVRYFQGKDAKGGTTAARAYGGLFYTGRNSVEFLDPWRKVSGAATANRHYLVILDVDYDDEIVDPHGHTLYGRRALAWCTGKDGEYGAENSSLTNRDNVYSWQ